MNSLNNTNFEKAPVAAKHGSALLRTATAIVVGSVIALAGVLPVSAAPPTTSAKKTTHTTKHTTTKRHHATTRRSTTSRSRVASLMKPKQVTIHGYADTHPYGRQVTTEAPRINVTVGRPNASTTAARRSGPPNEGHGPDKGGVIQPDGSVIPGGTAPGLPGATPPTAASGPLVTAPIGGYGPGGAPPIIVDTPPVVTTPTPPVNGPAAPATPPVVP